VERLVNSPRDIGILSHQSSMHWRRLKSASRLGRADNVTPIRHSHVLLAPSAGHVVGGTQQSRPQTGPTLPAMTMCVLAQATRATT
jgi:hypothetical protein